MEYTFEIIEPEAIVSMTGRFTFTDNGTFRNLLDDIDKHTISSLTINVSGIDYVDSAALGMFLLLRDHAEKKHILLTLSGAQGQVLKIFNTSRFDQLFRLK